MLTEVEGARLLFPRSDRQVVGRAPQRLPVLQHGAVQHHRQALRHLRLINVSFPAGRLVPLVLPPEQLRGRVRSEPGAVEEDVGGVLCQDPHTLRVSVWGIWTGQTDISQEMDKSYRMVYTKDA